MKQVTRTFGPNNTTNQKGISMNKLRTFAFCALVTPVITLSAGSVLAQQSTTNQDLDRELQRSQQNQPRSSANPGNAQVDQDAQRAGQPNSASTPLPAQDDQDPHLNNQANSQSTDTEVNARGQTHMESSGFLNVAPNNGMQSSQLIGAEVTTSGDDEVGTVSELIIDESGQIVAIVVGVGGFLGMGEKDVAIGWDDVTHSGTADERKLQVKATRESLMSAPEYQLDE